MRGLIRKEWYLCGQYARTIAIIVLFFFAYGFFVGNGAFFGSLASVMCMMMVISSFSYDQQSGWDRFALTTPVSRRMIVGAKYCFTLISGLSGAAVAAIYFAVYNLLKPGEMDLFEMAASLIGCFCGAMLMIAIFIPIIYKWGADKARFLFMGIALAPTAFFLLLSKLDVPMPPAAFLEKALPIAGVLCVVALIPSYFISLAIFKQKEL